MKELAAFVGLVSWLGGLAIASAGSWWHVLLAILLPPYAWYLLVKAIMISAGLA